MILTSILPIFTYSHIYPFLCDGYKGYILGINFFFASYLSENVPTLHYI